MLLFPVFSFADNLEVVRGVEGQPLAENARRLGQALEFLGTPLPKETSDALAEAITARDAVKIQKLLDPHVLVAVNINPESRVKVARGPAEANLQQHGFTPALIKVFNESTVKKPLHISSPQSGPRYGQNYNKRTTLKDTEVKDRFLQVEMYTSRPMTGSLSGLNVEYALALIYSSDSGKREATISFDVGQGTQDLGFRADLPVLFDIKHAVAVKLSIEDFDGKPTVGRFTFRDKMGRVYPAKAKRLAPDFFFQDQVYRPDGGTVLLPPGEFVMYYGRGPEYKLLEKKITVAGTGKDGKGPMNLAVKLERWINMADYGFYSGDHHIHAAGCAHYTNPTEGVFAEDMFLHVKGEGLNVGCNLTWGPCYDFQRQFFEPHANKISEPFCVLKYDLEISGFGSQAMGHVCLLNLKEQTYPGSDGTSVKGWPTWTTPVMRWTKQQGGFAGYAHSANGLDINPRAAAQRKMRELDANKDGMISKEEAENGLLPDSFAAIDRDGDGVITLQELTQICTTIHNKGYVHREGGRGVVPDPAVARKMIPNYVIPEMNGIGAQEICVSTAMGVCDFISAMDTDRVPEWNCWYHIMNCGFPLKASGETDFPCISGSRVGQGRVYVQMGKLTKIEFGKWCEGLATGHSYVSDGYAHAIDFRVNDEPLGGEVKLDQPGMVKVKAKVAFASAVPLGTATGGRVPLGDTRTVELIVNGKIVATKQVPADDKIHDLEFDANIERSSWVAIRHFPEMHTNPVNVIVGGKPIRASKRSAQWCLDVMKQLWNVRGPGIKADEREEARKAFDKAEAIYKKILAEAYDDTK